jgi:AsmA protein
MKRILLWLAILIGVLVLSAAALVFFFDANRFRPTLEASLSEALHRDVKLGKVGLSILSGSIEADDLEIAEDAAFGKAPFLRARAIRVGVELKPLIFEKKLNVTGITIEKPEISLIQAPFGDWNYSSLGTSTAPTAKPAGTDAAAASAAGLAFTVNRLNIADGSLTIRRTTSLWKPLVLENVNLEVKDFSPVTAFPFTLTTKVKGGGSIKMDGKAGPINVTDASMTAVKVNVNVSGLDLAATGLANYAPDMAGIISFDGSGETNGVSLKLKGAIKAEKLKLAKTGTAAAVPLQFNFDVDHNLRKHSGSLKKGDIRIGKAPASLTGTYYEQGQDMILKMNLDGPNMPVSEIVAMLGPLGIVLPEGSSLHDGTISVKLSMNGPADKLVADGSLSIRDTTLAGFDLGKKMSVIQQIAGMQTGSSTQIQNVSLTVHMSPEGIQAKDIQLNVPAMGDLRGDGAISPENALDFKMNVALHTSGAASIIADKPIPFFVQGTSSDPLFKPDIKGLAAEQMKAVKAEAGVAATNFLKGLFNGKKKEGE